ncbi:MAG: hypothetical protein M3R55_16685 [Acidobacteriota bacterium]|nr:hypothetical protein [Acidobacteriota bacterium]
MDTIKRVFGVLLLTGLTAACGQDRGPDVKTTLTPAATPTPAATTASPTPALTPAAPVSPEPATPESTQPSQQANRAVTIPSGTILSVRLATPIASDTSQVEQRIEGTLTRDVRVGGVEALGAGATLRGIVTSVERSARVKGRASIGFRFDRLSHEGQTYDIRTAPVSRVAPGSKKRDATIIGAPAAGGAILGGILGGGSGALKGGAIGGAAGTAAVLSTRGSEVRLAPGATVSVRLSAPLTVRR